MAAFADLCRFVPSAGGTTDWTYSSAVGGCQSPSAAGVQNGVKYKIYAISSDLTQWEIAEGAYNSGTGVFPRTTVLYNSSGTGTASGQSGAGTKINFSTVPQVSIVALAEDVPSLTASSNAFTGNMTVAGTLAVTGDTALNSTTASTSTTTGALKVSGGVGVAGSVFANAFNAQGGIVAGGTISAAQVNVTGSSPAISGTAGTFCEGGSSAYVFSIINNHNTVGDHALFLGVGPSTADSSSTYIQFDDGAVSIFCGAINRLGASGVQYTTSSDARRKFKLDESGIDWGARIDGLWVGDFEWKAYPGTPQLGVIAQQAKEFYPQGIAYNASRDVYSASYGDFAPLALWGVKDLRARIAALEAKLAG